MKTTTGIVAAAGFVLLLIAVTGGVWLYQQFNPADSSGANTDRGIFGSLFPFGDGGGVISDILNGGSDEPEVGPVPTLRKVSMEKVAGAGFATGINGSLAIRYIERNTGHLYETPVDSLTIVRLTNTTAPAVHDALWISASTSLMRFLDEEETIENFVGSFTSTSTDQQLQGIFLNTYSQVAVGVGQTILGVLRTPGGSTVETVNVDGTEPKVLLTSSIGSWVPHTGGNSFYVASAPSSGVPGSLYDISTGSADKVIGGIAGLSVRVRKDGTAILISGGGQNTVDLYVHDTKSNLTTALPRGTLVEKCAWVANSRIALCALPQTLPQGAYPDEWLLGRVHTSDDLWSIDTESLALSSVLPLEATAGEPMDVSNLVVSDDGRYAVFINRNDQTLWEATLTPR